MGVLGSLAVVWSYVMLVTPVSGTDHNVPRRRRRPASAAGFPGGPLGGSSEGQPGRANVQRKYMRILNSRFIHSQNQSVYLSAAGQEPERRGT